MDFDAIVKGLQGLALALGLEPPLLPVAAGLAIGLRVARASFEKMASGWMYAIVVPLGIAVAFLPQWFGGSGAKPGAAALAFIAITLLGQRLLQGIAEIPGLPPWLKGVFPADNQFVKQKDPPQQGGNP